MRSWRVLLRVATTLKRATRANTEKKKKAGGWVQVETRLFTKAGELFRDECGVVWARDATAAEAMA